MLLLGVNLAAGFVAQPGSFSRSAFGVAASSRSAPQFSWRMGKQAANGPFTPVVIAFRAVVGEKRFNQIRGKVNASSLGS